MTTYYVVFIYCDYRKEVDVQHLKVYLNREEALKFAKKYTSEKSSDPEYVGPLGSERSPQDAPAFAGPCGTEYDAPFLGSSYDTDEEEEKAYQHAKEELKIKPNMWYLRIAVSRVDS